MTDPIVIVGAGPTGLTAALELTRFGLPVRIFDRMKKPATTSRAIGIQARTLELFGQRGLADEMIRLGNPASGAGVYGGGQRLFRLDFGHVETRYPFVLMLAQSETERILTEAIARNGVTIERGVELVGLSQNAMSHDASPVNVVLRHPDGRLEEARTPWLIDAEGAHSVVRATLNLPFEGRTLEQTFALGDLHAEGDLTPHDLYIFSSEHGLLAMFPLGGDHFRLIASHPLSKAEPGTEPSLDELQRIYDQRSHIPARLHDLIWGSWFHINSRMVPQLMAGRLFLGGDSAHIHSPAGAQGMNTGIQDMINLGWKLALVTRGEASPKLLDTYGDDRLPVIRDVLSATEKLTGVIDSESHLLRGLFNHISPIVMSNSLVQEKAPERMSQVSLGYRDSPLSSNHSHSGDLHAGDRMPDLPTQIRLGGGWSEGRVLDALDPLRFVLLVARGETTGTLDSSLSGIVADWGGLAKLVEIAPPADPSNAAKYKSVMGHGSSVFLVRPDGYVGLAGLDKSIARELAAYREAWFTPGHPST